MKTHRLGRTDIHVTEICLGTMTWGSQNTEQEAHEQLDMAIDYGVNFIDTAEMYPTTPISGDTCGDTESMIGTWLKKRGKRDDVILATKVVGKEFPYIRDGGLITPDSIDQAIETSLQRLQTDYIDLYQLHWPNRGNMHFRNNWTFDASEQSKKTDENILALLQTLDKHVKAGNIRTIGLSNESAWGTMKFVQLAEQHNLPRVVSVQNEYSLMYRHHDLDMAEVSHHEDVGLLSYSPLAAGLLSGKYYGGVVPSGSRASINPDLYGRIHPLSQPVADAYVDLAKQYNIDPNQLAIAFCMQRPFMTSTIIGATSNAQLKINLESTQVNFNEELKTAIFELYRANPVPF